MNKQTILLASICLLAGLAVAPAFAQVGGVKVKVPFKFLVANKTLAEGEYVLSSVHEKVFVGDSGGKRVAMVLANAVGGRTIGRTGEVVFECYADHCFLSQVWTPGEDTGRQLLRSRLETEIAKGVTGKYFALLGTEIRK